MDQGIEVTELTFESKTTHKNKSINPENKFPYPRKRIFVDSRVDSNNTFPSTVKDYSQVLDYQGVPPQTFPLRVLQAG